jgi:hypothetical protein
MDLLKRKFCADGKQIGGVFVLPCNIAIEAIKYSRAKGVPILGVDGFILKGDSIQPIMEHSIDLSYVIYGYEKAIEFLKERKESGLFFEVTVNE